MKLLPVLATFAATASALSIPESDQLVISNGDDVEQFLIELSPGKRRWITEDEKWELRRVCSQRLCLSHHVFSQSSTTAIGIYCMPYG